ncbi:MAG: DUF4091 domain-containing protein [Arcanobacterium sp.]|nr:DUF4091 domain-containing protein [Arcanobacterium sp.]
MPDLERTEITVAVKPLFHRNYTCSSPDKGSSPIQASRSHHAFSSEESTTTAPTPSESHRAITDTVLSHAHVFYVGLVPANVPAPEHPDEGYFTHTPTLLPDPLFELPLNRTEESIQVLAQSRHSGWNSLWWDFIADPQLSGFDICVSANKRHQHKLEKSPTQIWRSTLSVHVIGTKLKPVPLVNIQWFHPDSLASYYGVDVWSEEHWKIIYAHMESCARMRINTLLTPVWTPPLDTAEGTYRRTVQLVDITENNGLYRFDFSRLDRWIDLMCTAGINNVEVPPLFTQWGARFCPHFIINDSTGTPRERFGWDTPATSAEYGEFLQQFIPALRQHLNDTVGENHVWYHISDEPQPENIKSYKAAKDFVHKLLDGAQILDALGEPDFLDLVSTPVVATDAIPRFRSRGVNPDFVYYCVSQNLGVSNRFLAQYPVRTRALGLQLYCGNAKGFLHWAFNFYNTQYSLGTTDPYRDTSAGGGFISGDSFVVYPDVKGRVVESLRHRILRAAFDDFSCCCIAEKLTDRDTVMRIIDPNHDLDYNAGWMSEPELLRRRELLNQLIEEHLPTRLL